ncbi:alpha/beta fold hydrolase [Lentzea sp. BCCO 10_0856]|uniref:Alpha/beta fold hydrolase n=1 Tax=Lentzea miocenica TaxID=3095431 RepID=A0ABU4TA38_9PSEU|nr:alpha/beta fold hydrolase [Lentzea sp. BCCO 10_0856]MDX8034778.1 alpha/beta fold hydrolase [Lentzea sp. BCCO 10_0856]
MARRKIIRITVTSLLVVLVLVTAALGGIGWYYSGELLEPEEALPQRYPETSLGVDDKNVVLAESKLTTQRGTFGLVWPGGAAKVGDIATTKDGRVERPLLDGTAPPEGTKVRIETDVYEGNPKTTLGLVYSEVRVPSELGEMPAWFVPATNKDTWVITVHGRGASREEALRVVPQLHGAGLPVLLITYRNDVGAPASPDGLYHLGDTEWRDVEAGIKYAQAQGARKVVLYGWSMGGAIVGQTLARSSVAAAVSGVVLDSPVTNWTQTLNLQAENRGVPTWLTPIAELVSGWRAGIDFDRFDLVRNPPALKPPTLLFHGSADGTVPAQSSRDLATAAGGLGWPLQYVEIPGADHTSGWNVATDTYRDALADFLTRSIGVKT